MAIELLSNCAFDLTKIQTLYVGSRLTNGNPIVYPIQYLTITGTTDSIIRIENWDTNNDVVRIGGQEIVVNKIVNTGDNISFSEEQKIDQYGKTYDKNLTFIIPNLSTFLINQLKEFTITASGLAQLAPTIAFMVDENDQTLVVGYDKPLYLSATDFTIGDTNDVSLSYKSSGSHTRARAYQIDFLSTTTTTTTIPQGNPPTVVTRAVSGITDTTATSGGIVTASGDSAVFERGIVYATHNNPILTDNIITNGSGLGTFTSNLTGLLSLTTYYIRAWAKNGIFPHYKLAYGNNVSFVASTGTTTTTTTTSTTTTTTTSTTTTTTTSTTTATPITYYILSPCVYNGIDYYTREALSGTLGSGQLCEGATGVWYHKTLTQYTLPAGVEIMVTAMGYGSCPDATTTTTVNYPSITTTAMSSISQNSAYGGGTIISNGGASIISSGIYWNTYGNPHPGDSHVSDGPTGYYTGGYGSYIMGSLLPSTTYYVKAYITTTVGTTLGNEVSFTTLAAPTTTTTTSTTTTTEAPLYYVLSPCTGGGQWYTTKASSGTLSTGALVQSANYYHVAGSQSTVPAGTLITVSYVRFGPCP